MASNKIGRKHVGKIVVPLSDLWEWSLGYRMPRTSSEVGTSQDLQLAYAWAAMVRKKKVAIGTVSGSLSAVGTKVALAYEGKPTKAQGEKTVVPQLSQMMEERRKEDPPTKKKFPVGIDVPELLAELGMEIYSTKMVKAVGDCAVIEFYYLLRVGEYTVKKKGNETKQTVQFKLESTMFFC